MFISIVSAAVFFVALVCWLYPRFTTFIDRRLTVPRLSASPCMETGNVVAHPISSSVDQKNPSPHFATSIDMVEELIRLSRSGIHAQDALSEVCARNEFLSSHFATSRAMHKTSVPEILHSCAELCEKAHQHDEAQMCNMLKASFVHGVFIPAALEHVRTTLRTRHAIRADIRTASAQATFTVRILTRLPIIACVILLVSSPDMRHRLFHLSILVILAIGFALNRMGALWIRTSIARTVNRPIDETIVLAEHLAASLRAGCSLTDALQRWEDVSPKGTAVSQAISRGERLEHAVNHLPQTSAGYRLAHTILSSHRDGLPVVNTVHRLMSDAHSDMRSATDTLIRQLPSRLSAPLVLCILPSFLIIAVVPLMLHSLGQLGPALSPAFTAVP